jgi:TRAP-type C4-dicarboxylate transport system permease small subunit
LGASIAIQQKASIEINIWPLIMEKFFQKETRRQKVDISIQILADTITILFIVLFCFLLVGFFHKLRCFGQVSPCLNLPIAIIVGGMVVSAVLMVFHYIVQVINNLSRY